MNRLRHPATRYLIALVMVAVAIFTRWLLTPYVEGRLPFACLMLALIVVSANGGLGPGLVTLVIGCLATMWFFLPPGGSLFVEGLPHQMTLVSFSILGLLIVFLGEGFRRARERAKAFETLLGIDFKQSGEIYVRTPAGLRHLSAKPSTGGASASDQSNAEGPLDRIVSEIIPAIADNSDVPSWQILANGKPIVNIELRDKALCEPGTLRKWVVTYINPIIPKGPVEDPY
ncbi:MAG: DUF4118 domain-containing protein [Planctomycetaceae bacterium]|nr:DUF4118 domain-containing protein [Planctomycetaceae bacterium]